MYQAVILDDEPFIVDSVTKAIDWSGFHIEIAFASTESLSALDYILSNPVDIIITDVSMPLMDGLQLIQKVKKAKPSTYIIVLSAYDNFEYTRTALRQGAENYLLKPLDSDELSDTISQIIGHIKEREQLNSTYGRAMMTFRNAFTEQWVKNLMTNTEIASKSEMLGINLNALNYTVIIISCSQKSDFEMSQFFDLLLRFLPGNYTGNFFFETPVRLVGVLSPADLNAENISSFILRISENAAASGIDVFISIGNTVKHYLEVHQSYQRADGFTFLEYSTLKYFFCNSDPVLSEKAEAALDHYEKSGYFDISKINELYQQQPPYMCTLNIISKRIQRLCKKSYELKDKYAEMAVMISNIPDKDASKDEFIVYINHFLSGSDQLLFITQQSMYPVVNAVIKSVSEFSDKDISLKTLAAKLNVTPSYLGTIFHQQTGYYFNDYLSEARLKYAAELLENSDMKIKDIVDKIGFSSQTYFNRSFKRYYDTSPLNYRREKKAHSLT